jgi:acetone carboxylase gamma subunit
MDESQIQKLIDGKLSWDELQSNVLPDPKDPDRFEKVRSVLQDQVEWDETVLVPLNDHLYVVEREDGDRIVKGECGHEYCDADDNWKRACQIRVRESDAEMEQLYPKWQTSDPNWNFQIREFFCPDCYSLLEVDAVPAGYPILQSFEPDIETFYEEWIDAA